jgi:TRAP-type mannitol/chloroaromatic compound transport system permease small subunit
MLRAVTSAIRVIDALSEATGRFASVFASLMVLVTCYIVVDRYLFNAGSVAVQESITYMNTLLFMLGAAYTLKHNSHVRVDIFYGPASARAKAWINLCGTLLLLLPVAAFILVYCWNYVAASWAIRESSPDTGGLPWTWLLKSLMLVMAMLLFAQGIADVLRNLVFLFTPAGSVAGSDSHESGTL